MCQQFLYLLNQGQLPGTSSSQGHVTSACTSQEHVIRVWTTLRKLVASSQCTICDTFPVFSPAGDTVLYLRLPGTPVLCLHPLVAPALGQPMTTVLHLL